MEEGLLTAFLLTVFLTVGVFSALKRVKNPVNTGENVLEPVVGIEPTTYGLRIRLQLQREIESETHENRMDIGLK